MEWCSSDPLCIDGMVSGDDGLSLAQVYQQFPQVIEDQEVMDEAEPLGHYEVPVGGCASRFRRRSFCRLILPF